MPCVGLGQVPAPFRDGGGSHGQLAWLRPLKHPFLCLYYVNMDVLQSPVGSRTFYMPNSLPQLTAAAGNFAYLRIWA
jgi:hypothetical protein